MSNEAVAKRFGISGGRVGQIVKRDELMRQSIEKAEEILKFVREANDLERKWDTNDLLDAIRFDHRARRCLNSYFMGPRENLYDSSTIHGHISS